MELVVLLLGGDGENEMAAMETGERVTMAAVS
jgi:hypothetical protein